MSDARYAVWDHYARQPAATKERVISDACYAVGNRYARQTAATRKSRISDACYTIGDRYTRQPTTIRERMFSNSRYTIGNDKVSDKLAIQIQVMCIIERVGSRISKLDCIPCRNIGYKHFF